MKISSVSVGEYSGNLTVQNDDIAACITLTKQECQQFTYLAERIYEQRQMRISEEFAKPLPALAHFTEVTDG